MLTKELTNDIIKEKLTEGLVYRGEATDANDCVTTGYWNAPSFTANIPSGTFRNILVCFLYHGGTQSSKTLTQILISHSKQNPRIYRRMMVDAEWYNWVQLH